MSNEIGGIDRRGAAVGAGGTSATRRDAGKSQSGQAAPAAQGGAVQITDSAAQLSQLEQTVRALPEVDSARVAQVSAALAQGTYRPDPQKIADGLIKSEQALAGLPAAKA